MKTKRLMVRLVKATLILCVLLVAVLGSELVFASNASPFVGHWQAIDLDGSDIRLVIAGPPNGPFRITWTESYISFCEAEAGIVQGIGTLNEGDPYLLEADLHVECFTTGASLDFHLTFRYHPSTDKLSTRYENGFVTIWSRPGRVPPPPELGLRVNYGHDWVESFYEDGHVVWITVTESDGVTVKATAEVITEPKDFWDGETGFQTNPEDWNPAPPEIQPYDWVYAFVSNGASAQVQIGEINGFIDFEADTIQGGIIAPWYSDELFVECFPWGAPDPQPEMKYDAVYSEDSEGYSCSWAGDWEINRGQDVGVGYIGPDGHWVANTFYKDIGIVASEAGDWFWTSNIPSGDEVSAAIYTSRESGDLLWEGSRVADEEGFIYFNYDDHGIDLVPRNYLVISDSEALKGLVLEPVSIHTFNTLENYMAGTAPFGREVLVGAGLQDYQDTISVIADKDTGEWIAYFTDITEDMRWWSWAEIFDEDGDANEGSNPPRPEIRAWTATNRVEGYQWPLGSEIKLYINDFETPLDIQTVTEGDENWTRVEFNLDGWTLEPGQEIWMIGGGTEKYHTILPVSISNVDVDANIVDGTSSPGGRIILCIYQEGCDPPAEIYDENVDGFWQMDYGSSFDIQNGFGMDATEFDENGDGTSFEYWLQDL